MADGTVKIGTELDKSGFEKGLHGLGSAVKQGFSVMGGAASAFAKTSVAAIGAATTAITAAGGATVTIGQEFESSFAKASTLFGDVAVDTAGLKKKILEVSDTTGVLASNLNESLYSALSAGIPVTEDMSEATAFLESSAKLAKAGFTDMDTALSATAKTLNAYGLDVSEADRINKILIQTQNKGITTVGELGASLAQVTPTAAAFGVSFENVGAALSNMTAAGTPTAQATTQLNNLIAELGKAGTTGAKSLEKAAEGTRYAGMSFREMMDAGVPLNEVLDMVRESADQSGLSMVDMFSSIEAGKAALALSGENSEKFASNLEAMGTSADVVTEAYDKVSNTLANKVSKIANSAKNLGIQVYNGIQEPLKGMADVGLGYLDELSQAFSSSGVGGLVDAGANIVTQVALGAAENLPTLIDTATDFITTLGDGIIRNLPQLMAASGQIIASLASGVMAVSDQLLTIGGTILVTLADGIIAASPSFGIQGAQLINQFLLSVSGAVPGILAKGTEVITSLASGISAALPQIIPTAVQAILGFAQGLVNNLPRLVDAGLQMLQAVAEGVANSLPTVIEMVPKLINSFADTVYSSLPKILAAGVKILATLGKGIVDSIPTIIANAGEIIKAIINVISLANLASLGKGLIHSLANGIKGMKASIAEAGGNLMNSLVTKIKTTNWVDVGRNIILGIVNGIKNSAGQMVKAAVGAVDDALNWVKKKLDIHSPSRVFRDEVGKNIALGIAEGIEKNKDYAKKSIEEIAAAVLQAAKTKLDNEQVYHDLSLADEVAYWDRVRKQVKEGTQARIDADREYLTRKKSLNQKMTSIEQDYTDRVRKAHEDLEKSIQSLRDAYSDELTSRTKDIMGSIGLFDEFTATTELSTDDLLDNLQSQVTGLRDWSNNLKELERRGVSGDMLDELRSMGTDAAGEIAVMTQMTDAQLDEYISLWKQKQRIARQEAKQELEPMLEDTEEQISRLREQTALELAQYKQEYIDAMREIGVEIQQPLQQVQTALLSIVAQAVSLVAGTVSGEADNQNNVSQFAELGNSILHASAGLPQDFSALGMDTVAGMIQGLQAKSGELYTAMAEIIRQAVQTAKDEAQIHSPSRLMRDMIGRNMIAGIGVGFELESEGLNDEARDVIRGTAAAMREASAREFVRFMKEQSVKTSLIAEIPFRYRWSSDEPDFKNLSKVVLEKGSIEVPVILEGKEVAKVSAPFMDTELGSIGEDKERGK